MSADAFLQVRIAAYDSGGTLIGELYNGQTATSTSLNDADPNRRFEIWTLTRCLVTVPITPVTIPVGGYLVVETGGRLCNTSSTSRNATIQAGDPTTGTPVDLTAANGTPVGNRCWVEFSLTDLPNVPTSLSEDASHNTSDLTWAAPSGGDAPTGYDVRLDSGSWVPVGLVLTYEFTGLTPDTTYSLQVRATNAAGAGPSASISSTTTGPPDVPTDLVADPGETTIDFTWSAPAGGWSVFGYNVRIDGGTPIDVWPDDFYQFTGLATGTTYTLEVQAYNVAGESAWVSIESTTTRPGVVAAGAPTTLIQVKKPDGNWAPVRALPPGA